MQLTILGAGTALPLANRSAAGYLVRVNGTPLLFDAGPGTIARLATAGVSYRDLEHVFITHLHSDHTLDLVTLLQALVSTPGWKRERPLYLTGCRGLTQFVQGLTETFNGVAPRGYALTLCELGEERVEFPGWTIQTALTGHTDNSIAFRVEAEGRALVYSGDAVETENLVQLARGADVLLCECSLPNDWPPTNHLTPGGAGRIARAARVKRLILTHLYPPVLETDPVTEVRAEFDGPVHLAMDGMRLEV